MLIGILFLIILLLKTTDRELLYTTRTTTYRVELDLSIPDTTHIKEVEKEEKKKVTQVPIYKWHKEINKADKSTQPNITPNQFIFGIKLKKTEENVSCGIRQVAMNFKEGT